MCWTDSSQRTGALTCRTSNSLTRWASLFGRDSTFVSFDGDFKGMGAEDAKKNYRLLGLVQPTPQFTLFVKLTGPKDLVAANEAAFDQFCQSIDIKR